MQKDSLVVAQSYGETNGQKPSGGLLRSSYPQSHVSLQLKWRRVGLLTMTLKMISSLGFEVTMEEVN